MGQYRMLAHVTYLCKYHVVFCPKYRYRVLKGKIGQFTRSVIRQICEWKEVEIEAGHVSGDHVHLVLSIPPKYSVSNVVGTLKGRTAIRLLKKFPSLRGKGYRRVDSGANSQSARRTQPRVRSAGEMGNEFPTRNTSYTTV